MSLRLPPPKTIVAGAGYKEDRKTVVLVKTCEDHTFKTSTSHHALLLDLFVHAVTTMCSIFVRVRADLEVWQNFQGIQTQLAVLSILYDSCMTLDVSVGLHSSNVHVAKGQRPSINCVRFEHDVMLLETCIRIQYIYIYMYVLCHHIACTCNLVQASIMSDHASPTIPGIEAIFGNLPWRLQREKWRRRQLKRLPMALQRHATTRACRCCSTT